YIYCFDFVFFFSSRRRHTIFSRDWSSDVCSSDLNFPQKHVLLKSYTDIFGDDIPASQVEDGNVYSQDFNVSLPSNVTNSQNLYRSEERRVGKEGRSR